MQLYIGLRQLPVFRLHRLSKALAAWRRAVAGAKGTKARAALAGAGGAAGGGGLFALSPAFQAPLRRVWGLCCNMEALRLHAVTPGRVLSLPEFVAAHKERRAACAARLAAFRSDALRIVKGACAASLEALELQLQSFTIKQISTVSAVGGGGDLATAGSVGGSATAAGGGLRSSGGGGPPAAGLAALGDRELQLVIGGLGASPGRRAAGLAAMMGGWGGEGGGGAGDQKSQQVRLRMRQGGNDCFLFALCFGKFGPTNTAHTQNISYLPPSSPAIRLHHGRRAPRRAAPPALPRAPRRLFHLRRAAHLPGGVGARAAGGHAAAGDGSCRAASRGPEIDG